MDEADRASLEEERALREATYRASRTPHLKPTGVCHWCDEPVEENRIFCDRDCREDWERAEAARERNGRQED